jgi:hypothetical protein
MRAANGRSSGREIVIQLSSKRHKSNATAGLKTSPTSYWAIRLDFPYPEARFLGKDSFTTESRVMHPLAIA